MPRFELQAFRNRTQDFTVTLFAADGVTPLMLNVGDTLRIKIGRGDIVLPALDLDSVTPTANGSKVTITTRGTAGPPIVGAAATLRLSQADIELLPFALYQVEIFVVDSTDQVTSGVYADKEAQRGCLYVLGSQSGNTGLTP
jgi:hypothetical protein